VAGTQQPHTGRSLLRSSGQNDIFHAWCRVIATHLQSRKSMLSAESVKQLVKRQLGNVKMIEGVPGMPADILAMSTSLYKKTEADLTRADHDSKFISMSQLLGNMEAWAATDLDGLILPREIKE